MFEGTGMCHYLGVLFLKSAELAVSVFEICPELCVQFEERYRNMGTALE